MAAGTPQQQGPVACEPRREEQTSLPSVSHPRTPHLHIYPKHPLPDSAVRSPFQTLQFGVQAQLLASLWWLWLLCWVVAEAPQAWPCAGMGLVCR